MNKNTDILLHITSKFKKNETKMDRNALLEMNKSANQESSRQGSVASV